MKGTAPPAIVCPVIPPGVGRGVVGETWHAGATDGCWLDEVFLDGVRLDLCVKANSAQGWAVVYVEDDKGEIVRNVAGQAETTILYGVVEIRRCN